MAHDDRDWRDQIFTALKDADISLVGYVPDAGHAKLIEASIADNDIDDVALTTEEEGVALATGAWLGGQKVRRPHAVIRCWELHQHAFVA